MNNVRKSLFIVLALALFAGCAKMAGPPARVSHEKLMKDFMQGRPLPTPAFTLAFPGSTNPVDYARYGTFTGIGTRNYAYNLTDIAGLKAAVGEGIFPNEDAVTDDPAYAELQKKGALSRSHWDALRQKDMQVAFFTWAMASEDPGVKAYHTAVALERAGLIFHAIKAYHSVVVNFPGSACWGEDGSFVWYVAPNAVASIRRLCQEYPSLGLWYEGGKVEIQNANDTNLGNDIVIVDPGRIISRDLKARLDSLPKLAPENIVERRPAKGRVQVVRFANGHWQLQVGGKPFFVRGVTYGPTEIGLSPNNKPNVGTVWMFTDKNKNNKADAPYDAWVDKNGNGTQDADEPAVGDFQLLKDMGCNAIRLFLPTTRDNKYDPSLINKPLLRDLYKTYGISVIAGDFLGAYTIGSGATWQRGTDYTNPDQKARMKEIVRQKVLDLRGEDFVLMWLLGNENNMSGDHTGINATRTNAGSQPEAYARFVNEVAEMIHELDPTRPVAIGNLGTGLGEYYAQFAPAIDIFSLNAYMGVTGFGNLWQEARAKFDRPVLIVEYGCDAYAQGRGPDEPAQAIYHEGGVKDITLNQGGGPVEGNSIGGVIFEYVDEWWKGHDSPQNHDRNSQWTGPMPDGKVHEEWFGIVGQGSGRNSPFERNLRLAYWMYREMWTGKEMPTNIVSDVSGGSGY